MTPEQARREYFRRTGKMASGKEALRMITQKAETKALPASDVVRREKDLLKNPIFYSGYEVVSSLNPEYNKKAKAIMAMVKKAAEDQMKERDAEFKKKLKAEDDKKSEKKSDSKADGKPKLMKPKLMKSTAMKTSRASKK